MATTPTIQKPSTSSAGQPTEKRLLRPLGSSERRSELVTKVKYTNTLPDLPFDPKFIAYPFDHNRFVNYSTTSLERTLIFDVHTEADLGVEVELVIPNYYHVNPNGPQPGQDPDDEKLLEDEIIPQKNQKRSRHHAKPVSWLRRTEYISTEPTRFQPTNIDKAEAKVGYSIKKKLKDEWHYSDRDSQIKAIEKTFEDASKPIETHFAKPGVVPVEILPVFPDFKLWKYPAAQVIFDSDPAPMGRSVPVQLEEMSQAMIRGEMDESGEQFVAYFLPTEETLEKRKRDMEKEEEYVEDEVYEYRKAREYNWNVKSEATKGYEEKYFFVIRDDGVYYNELETRVRLNKRRTRGPHQQLNTKLCVKHIALAPMDYKFQRKREQDLEPLAEEDEEEEEEKSDGDKSDDEKSVKSNPKSEDEKSEKSGSEDEENEKSRKSDDEKSGKSIKSDDEKSVKSDKSDDESDKSDDEKSQHSVKGSRSSSKSNSDVSDNEKSKSEHSGSEDEKSGGGSDAEKSEHSEHEKSKSEVSDSD